jgi:hypothetical protein
METLQLPVGEFKSLFSEALECVARGESVCATYRQSRKAIALFSPPPRPVGKRKLGTLSGKVNFRIFNDWSLSAEELVNL